MDPASSKTRLLEAIERSSLSAIIENLQLAERIELFPNSRVVVLDVRFSELRHACDEDEWAKFKQHLREKNTPRRRAKWWEFYLRWAGRPAAIGRKPPLRSFESFDA